jgi:hypothetical protein
MRIQTSTGNVGIGTTTPNAQLDVHGPNSVYQNDLSTLSPNIVQITDGGAGHLLTTHNPTMAITRQEANSTGLGTGTYALEVSTEGTSTAGIAQISGMGATAKQLGTADATGVTGQGFQVGPAGSNHAAFGGYFQAYASFPGLLPLGAGSSALALELGAINYTGNNLTYAHWVAAGALGTLASAVIGIDNASTGTNTTTFGEIIRNSGQPFDIGIYFCGATGVCGPTVSSFYMRADNGTTVNNIDFQIDNGGNAVFHNIYFVPGGAATAVCMNTTAATVGSETFALLGSCTSDERLKHNIVPVKDGALAKILAIEPVNYVLNNDKTDAMKAHVIAQNVLPQIPEAVIKNADGYYSVDDGALISYLIKSVQELNAQVQALKAR